MNKILFNLVFFCLFFLFLDLYFWQALKSNFLFNLKSNQAAKIIYWVICLSTISIVIYGMINYQNPEASKHLIVIRAFIFSLYMAKLFACFPLLIDDLIRLFKWIVSLFSSSAPNLKNGTQGISRLSFLKNMSFLIGTFVFSVMSWGIIYGRFNFKKHQISLRLNKWPKGLDGLKIIQISDLHLGSFDSTKPIEEVVDMINNENADIIVFTGDMINNSYWEADEFIPYLSKLKAKHGKFSVLGNHDYGDYLGIDKNSESGMSLWKSNFNKMLKIHDKIGFDLLLNENRDMQINGHQFNLIGVENWGAGRFSKYGDFDKSIQGLDANKCNILLSHDPSHWGNEIINHPFPIELQLSGHTHGMQFGVELKNFKWSPAQLRYPQWAGLYSNDEKHVYVNRGLGHIGYAGRIGIYPEISVINIYSKA